MAKKDEDFLEALGARVRDIRERKGLSLRKLEVLASVDFSQIHRIEKGETNPSIIVLRSLANALEVDLSDLVNV